MQDIASDPDPEPEPEPVNKEEILMRRAGLWRTIILSSLGKTLYPYCLYFRALDLESLECLLIDRVHGANARK